MYSLRLYKYRDSYVLYTPTVQLFSSLLHTHTLLVKTHKHDVSAPGIGVSGRNVNTRRAVQAKRVYNLIYLLFYRSYLRTYLGMCYLSVRFGK